MADWLGRVWPYLLGLVALTAAFALLGHFVVADVLAPYAVGAIVASGAWVGYVLWIDSSGVANMRAGIDGEQLTVSELRPLLRRGWRLVNHAQWAQQAARSARDLHLRTDRLQPVTPIVVMWGPHVADFAPTPNERDGVMLCAGSDLVAVATAGHASLDEPAIESVYDALDAYVRKRTIGEERIHGPKPRAIADHMLDLLLGVFAGFLSIIAIAYIARLEPELVSYPLGCVALIATAAVARRRWPHPRIRALSIGMIAPSMFLLMTAIVVGLVALITS